MPTLSTLTLSLLRVKLTTRKAEEEKEFMCMETPA
jgi:hypothetical protein